MPDRHSDVATEPRPPNVVQVDSDPARRSNYRTARSADRTRGPEKTMMDCKKLREVLDAYVDRELAPDAAAHAEAHIAECNGCRRAVEALTKLRETVRAAAGKPEAPAH